ncbi:DNA repair protein XRCC1 [Ochlerotatus camptorhynchus]|uniref:DNA repair protein XRCC1 n=1 Tax=Ochlerotatus camptorhynchus TaxID=644619 RepID=UPI0031DF1C33
MPNVILKSVESFSSEDPNFPASNLLAKEARKWKCREAGEKSASVVLRLEKPLTIHGIDVGNEHSAFIEVLVARSGPTNPEFKEILLMSSFMTPIESRNSTSSNRVRCFTASALVEPVAREQWDLVKIICTQPFNSRVQYGVAFVTLHTANVEKKHDKPLVPEKFKKQIQEVIRTQEQPKVMKLGRFTIREESPDSPDEGNISASALFNRWKESRTGLASPKAANSSTKTSVLSTAAAIRNASTPAGVRNRQSTPVVNKKPVSITPKTKPRLFDDDDDGEDDAKSLNRNRESLLYDKDDDKPNEKLEKKIAEDRARQQREKDAKVEKEKRDRSLSEKKGKTHDSSAPKFKDFLFDDPPVSKNHSSEKKSKESSASEDKRHRSRSPQANGSSPDKHQRKRRDSKEDDHREKKSFSDARQKRPSESPATTKNQPSSSGKERSASKRPKLQFSDDEEEAREKSKRKPATYKPFNKLLENVVLVISGIQNPGRANLRNQAIALGAKYKSDWDPSCTHLICAFKNTPKYNQVRGKGKIIKKDWIERCHALQKRLSWRKFALDSSEAEQTDSEGEIVDIANKPSPTGSRDKTKESKGHVRETDEEALAHYDLDDVELVENPKPDTVEISGSDTEEEIERVKQKKQTKETGAMYDKSTEDEGQNGNADAFAPLEFFKGKTFFVDPEIGAVDMIKLERYIQLYKGTVAKTPAEAYYIVTRNNKPMGENFKGELIKPLWVYECHDMECLIPSQRYRP